MRFTEDEFNVGGSDICLDEVEGRRFYIGSDQFEYWRHTRRILNVTPGRGRSFLLEIPQGVRFFFESRLFTEEELTNL